MNSVAISLSEASTTKHWCDGEREQFTAAKQQVLRKGALMAEQQGNRGSEGQK